MSNEQRDDTAIAFTPQHHFGRRRAIPSTAAAQRASFLQSHASKMKLAFHHQLLRAMKHYIQGTFGSSFMVEYTLNSEITFFQISFPAQDYETEESGDLIPDDTSTSFGISHYSNVEGFVNESYERDWYVFTAAAGVIYGVHLDGDTLVDPSIKIHDENGTLLEASAYTTVGDWLTISSNSELIFSFEHETKVYIDAGAYAFGTGSYDLSIESIIPGTSSDDSLVGDDGRNWVEGYEGKDTILGKNGKDTLRGGDGADWIDAGEGHDKVYGGQGADYIILGAGSDYFDDTFQSGASGSDTVYGGADRDFIYGSDGWDEYHGGGDNDYLSGGRSDDRLYGDGGNDQISGNDGDDIMFGGHDDDTLKGGQGKDDMRGGNGNDVMYGGAGRDEARLGNGNDIFIDGSQGGKNGQDKIFGGSGEDTIYAGGGDDRIVGGSDADLFVFEANGWDEDTIIDFEDGLDMIQLARPAPGDEFADLTVEDQNGFTAVFWTANPGDVILLKDITVNQISEDDFTFV